MNILHVTPYYAPAYEFGGVVRSVEGMAQALAQRGHNVTVLTTDAKSQTERVRYNSYNDEMLEGVRVVRARNASISLRGKYNLSTPINRWPLAQELINSADVIHCHEFRTVENLLVTPIAKRRGKPLVLSPHGTLKQSTGRSGLKSAWDKLLSPAVARRFDHVIGLTQAEVEEAKNFWTQFGAAANFSIVPNGVNPEEYAPTHPKQSVTVTCLFMARIHPRKGAHILADAFLWANIPDTQLVIAGPDEGGLHLITREGRIKVLGYLSGEDRIRAFHEADVFALFAHGEGLPMVVLEAMAAGLPVIISPDCNLPEVAEYHAGVIVPGWDELAAALRDLMTDADKRKTMGDNAQKLVRERFTWDSIAVRLEQVYQSLI